MDGKTELLISLGAATAANCAPCFEYYFKKATAAGVPSDEMRKAVELANKIKTGASICMRKSIGDISGYYGESDQPAGGTADHPCCH